MKSRGRKRTYAYHHSRYSCHRFEENGAIQDFSFSKRTPLEKGECIKGPSRNFYSSIRNSVRQIGGLDVSFLYCVDFFFRPYRVRHWVVPEIRDRLVCLFDTQRMNIRREFEMDPEQDIL